MSAYYNEFNPEAAGMLRQMIKDGHIAAGDVDDRSITEVSPDDIKPYTQCHFFAGIGGWSIALRLAGWPDDMPVWTGSAPCQPFSSAGRQKGKSDTRHLFPIWLGLIQECKPATIFGEQVATAVTHGWLDDVYSGLEAEGYAVGAAVLPACSVGAPHRRDRLWFVAHAEDIRHEPRAYTTKEAGRYGIKSVGGPNSSMADTECCGPSGQRALGESLRTAEIGIGETDRIDHAGSGMWDGQWQLGCDGKTRLIEPSIPLLVDGVQHRRPILHALGNAIVPQVAAEFIKASQG